LLLAGLFGETRSALPFLFHRGQKMRIVVAERKEIEFEARVNEGVRKKLQKFLP